MADAQGVATVEKKFLSFVYPHRFVSPHVTALETREVMSQLLTHLFLMQIAKYKFHMQVQVMLSNIDTALSHFPETSTLSML